jgi:MFS transporter, putative metabolite:H+ symporter
VSISITARMDALPLTRLHVLAAAVCAVGFGIDLAEISLGHALSAVFSAPPYRLAPLPLAWVLSGVYVGAVIGAPLVGWASQHRGLGRALQWLLLWLAATSCLVATGSSATGLGTFRALSGIALGAYPPLMIAYLTEIAPPRLRGRLIFFTCAAAYLVPPMAVLTIRWLTPLAPLGIEGWRWPFLAGGVCALLAGIGFQLIPESPRWLLTNRRMEPATAACRKFQRSPALQRAARERRNTADPGRIERKLLLPTRKLARPLPFVASMYALHPWATSAFPLLTGPVLLERGFKLTDTLLYVGMGALGPAVGTLLGGLWVDRLDRRVTLLGCALLMLVSIATFFVAHSPIGLLLAVVMFGVGVALYTPAMTVYGAELFPTRSRTQSTAAAWACNRIGSALVPILLLPLLSTEGPLALCAIVCAALIASALLVGVAGPSGATGAAVE